MANYAAQLQVSVEASVHLDRIVCVSVHLARRGPRRGRRGGASVGTLLRHLRVMVGLTK